MAATEKIWVNDQSPTCEDTDLNGFKNENNNLIVGSGQLISTADNQQTHKAVAHYSGVGDYYAESGGTASYILSTTGAQVAPPTYATGMKIRFVAGNTNTGPATVNVATLGVKDLIDDATGSTLSIGAIVAGKETQAYYDGADFRVTSLARSSKVRAHLSAAQGIPTGSTEIVAFDGETFDVNSDFTTGATGQFKPTAAGYYSISAHVSWGTVTLSAAWVLSASIYKTGVGVQIMSIKPGITHIVTTNLDILVEDIVFLNGTTDYIDIRVNQTSGASLDVRGVAGGHLTNLAIHRVSD